MKLATTTGDFFSYTGSQTECLKYIREAGFRYADYNFGCDHTKRTGIYSDDYQAFIEGVRRASDDLGIKLVQSHAPMGKPFLEEGELLIKDTLRCIDACADLGIPNLVVHAGYAVGLTKEQNFQRNKEFFAPLLERAEKYGVNILVENFNKMYKEGVYWVDNAPDLLAMIEYVDHPLFNAVWDVGHANLQEMPQDEGLRILGSYVKAVHIQDNMGTKDQHLAPFFGTLNLDSVINGLKDIGFDGYFTFEVGGVFTPMAKRREYAQDTRLAAPPLELKRAFEAFLYTLGKTVLEKYNCFEE